MDFSLFFETLDDENVKPVKVNQNSNQSPEQRVDEIPFSFSPTQTDPMFLDFIIDNDEANFQQLFNDFSFEKDPNDSIFDQSGKDPSANESINSTETSGAINSENKPIDSISKAKSSTLIQKNGKTESLSGNNDLFAPRQFRKKPKNQPKVGPPESFSEDERFINLINDNTFTINPTEFGFIPYSYWPNQNFCFGSIVYDFFRRKNNQNCRFGHKLYNALQLTKHLPYLNFFFGVEWASSRIIKVNKFQFARLLGIHSIDGSFFHRQGNFTTHGFVELSIEEALEIDKNTDVSGVDLVNVKLLMHKPGIFVRGVKESDIEECKWVNCRKNCEEEENENNSV